jgi:hypothetical protein
MTQRPTQTVALDQRASRQLEYLTQSYVLATGDAPSASQLVRYALHRLTDHVSDLAIRGKAADSKTFTSAAVATETKTLDGFARFVSCGPVHSLTDGRGRLMPFAAAVGAAGSRASLSIPTKGN